MNNLRKKMKELNIDCLLITSNDFNMSEYVNDYYKAREYYSRFTGSAGSLVIDENNAYLFTDGRYFIQAKRQLKEGIKLMRLGIDESLESFLSKYKIIGADLRTIPATMYKDNYVNFPYIFEFYKRNDIKFSNHIILDDSITGISYLEKINIVRNHLKEKNADYQIITKLDEINYLLNIRGYDIKYSMLNYGYLIIGLNEIIFFSDETLNLPITQYKYNEFYDYLKSITGKCLIDKSTINAYAYSLIKNKEHEDSFINELKSIKNNIEINNTKKALLKDSSIMIRFIDYIKNNYKTTTENKAKEYLDNLRLSESDILDLSFETICAYNKSAAQLHYNGMDDLKLDDGFLLVDSGAQYKYGTTDITRTILLGNISDEFKKYYTYTLKSLIALSKAIFRKGTLGGELDFLARSKIYDLMLDYRCGTGHGVGFISNVHEGPNSFRYHNQTEIKENTITTIEPGIYLDDLVGIRLENMVVCKKIGENEFGEFYNFETLTFIPFEIEAIDVNYLNKEEIDWINNYHLEIFNNLKDYFKEDLELLKKYTKIIKAS